MPEMAGRNYVMETLSEAKVLVSGKYGKTGLRLRLTTYFQDDVVVRAAKTWSPETRKRPVHIICRNLN
jgi:hypothetical protein